MRPSAREATRGRCARFRSLALVVSVLASGLIADRAAVSQEAKNDGRSELVLTNLPPRGSRAYKDLLGLAGKEANGQVLGFTQSEMWSMPSARIEGVIRQGEALGVKMTRLSADWNQILKPPSAPMAMSGPQETMLKVVEGAKETMGVGMMASPNAAVVEYALMKDHDPKSAIGNRPAALISKIAIPLNGKETIIVRRTSVDMRHDGCTWRGEIDGTGEPVMIMWWKSGRFTGMLTYRGHMYTLMNLGGEVHAVVESDPGKMPPDHGAMRPQGATQAPSTDVKDDPLVARGEGATLRPRERSRLGDRQDALGQAVSPTNSTPPKIVPMPVAERRALAAKKITIDLMVLFTSKVASKYIDVDADLTHLSVEQANQSFANSGIGNITLRLVHQELIDYDESDGEHFNHLYRMVDGVGVFSRVRALRNEKHADVVALVVDDPSGCGLSTRVGADADEAFIVVHHSCAALTYSMAHEVGHIIGARHDRALDQNAAPFAYGHGYVNGTKWRDIMSYKASCDGCPRVPIWSNPTIDYRGDRAGTVDADNARVILEQAERVSKFR
jgi:metallopeptidase family M12-like protein